MVDYVDPMKTGMTGQMPGGAQMNSMPRDDSAQKAARTRALLMSFLGSVLFPWLVFAGVGLVFLFAYYAAPKVILGSLMGIAMLFLFAGVSMRYSSRMGPAYTLFLSAIAILVGSICGLGNYNANLFNHYEFYMRQQYTNVTPDEPAAAHDDAAVIVFASGASPDVTRPIGFDAGETYCVAPIVSRTAGTNAPIQYFAAGLDCCNGRRGFTCGDIGISGARTGLVMREPVISVLGQRTNLPSYKRAAKMAGESYGFDVVDNPIFVRWIYDVDAQHVNDLHAAFMQYAWDCFVFFWPNLVFGLAVFAVPGILSDGERAAGWKAFLAGLSTAVSGKFSRRKQ